MSQPPDGPSWPPQQPERPPYSNPTQPLPPYRPPYPNPTQPLPPYRPSGQWGGGPPGPPYGPPGPPYGPPGPPYGPPPAPGPPWGEPPRRNTTMIVVLAIVALLVVGGGVTGLVLATSGKKKHDTHQTGAPSNPTQVTPSGTSPPDFPSGSGTDFPASASTDFPTDFPTDSGPSSSDDDTSVKAEIALNAETVLHALGRDEPTQFCPLIDPADLQRLLREKHLSRCSDVKLNASSDKTEYQTVRVEDPSVIEVNGDTAHIPAVDVSPTDVGAVDMRRDTDGTWKFRFYS